MSANPQSKTCTDCNEVKAIMAFLPSTFKPDGLTDKCRRCIFSAAARDRKARESHEGEFENPKDAA